MNPQSPVFALILLLTAFLTTSAIRKASRQKGEAFRYHSIEGLRGFLALAVFIHHSSIWYQFLHTGRWTPPTSNLYNQLGRVGVTMFFMITSFLFTNKLINSDKPIIWSKYFISRIRRLVPLFYVATTIQVILLLIATRFIFVVNPSTFISSLFHWYTFTVFSTPTINNYGFTSLMCAGVVWSLPYEWLFYFAFPILALLIVRKPVPVVYLLLSAAFLFIFNKLHPLNFLSIYPFFGGAIAPVLMKYTPVRKVADKSIVSLTVLLCIASLLGLFHNTITFLPAALIIIAFTLIACGNSLFGLLKNETLKLMGDMGYSTYLLHGMLLFTIMNFGIGYDKMRQFTPMQYWLFICVITPLLMLISYGSFKLIEQPFMSQRASLKTKAQ